jgi:hypothetical protein
LINQLGIWLIFFIALFRTIKLALEAYREVRMAICLASPTVDMNQVTWANHDLAGIGITTFAWTAFGFLLSV